MNKKSHHSENGQALVVLAIGFVVMLGFTALAIDGGMVYADRRQVQNAADAAAMSAALAKVNNQNWQTAGMNRANDNGYDDNGITNNVSIYNPPVSGQYVGDSEYMQVIITATVNTSLIQFVFQGGMENTIEAIARAKPSESGPFYSGNAIVGLKPTGCRVVWKHGNPDTEVDGGGVWSNSNDPSCAFEYNGAAGDLTVNPPANIGVVGGAEYHGGTPNATVVTGQQQLAYPPWNEIPAPTCSQDAVWDEDTHTLSPGNWTGSFPPDREAYLNPGIFCITDSTFRVNAHDILEGDDILLYLINGSTITWNGNGQIKLGGRHSGPYQGMVIYVNHQDYANPGNCSMTLNGSEDSEFTGTIYAPTCDIRMLGAGETTGWKSQVIGYTVELGGNSNFNIYYEDTNNYLATNPPVIELTK